MKRADDVLSRLRYGMRHPVVRAGGILALTLSLCALLALFAWWGPMKLEQWKYQEVLESKRKAWLDSKRALELSQGGRKASATVALLETKLDSQLNQAEAVQIISRLAAKHGVRVLSQSFEAAKKQERVATLFIDLTLLGSYQGMRGMLEDLPNMRGWVEVLEAAFDSALIGGAQVKGQLTLAAYRYAQSGRDGSLQ